MNNLAQNLARQPSLESMNSTASQKSSHSGSSKANGSVSSKQSIPVPSDKKMNKKGWVSTYSSIVCQMLGFQKLAGLA